MHILSTPFPIITFFNEVQLLNMLECSVPMATPESSVAIFPRSFTPSPMIAVSSELQLAKASIPISVTEFGIMTLVRVVLFLNASLVILVILYLVPLYSKTEGIITSVLLPRSSVSKIPSDVSLSIVSLSSSISVYVSLFAFSAPQALTAPSAFPL